MRFSTVTILAFIAYTGNQAMAAPLPSPPQSLGDHESYHGQSHGGNGSHGHAKHGHAHITAKADEESAEQIAEPEDTEFVRPHPARGHSRHHHRQNYDSKSSDAPKTQDIQARPLRGGHHSDIMANKHNLQNIEARSPHGHRGGHHSKHAEENRKRDLQAIEARSPGGQAPLHPLPGVMYKRDYQEIEARSPRGGGGRQNKHASPDSFKRDLQAIEARSPGSGPTHRQADTMYKRDYEEIEARSPRGGTGDGGGVRRAANKALGRISSMVNSKRNLDELD